MSELHSIAASRHAKEHRIAQHAESSSGSSANATAAAQKATRVAADSVQVSLSPQGLKEIEDAAVNVASAAKHLVQEIGHAGAGIVSAAADAIEQVGTGTAQAITSSADAVAKGMNAVRSGVRTAAHATSHAVSEVSQQVGDVVENAAGYTALATLAGGALLNELV